MEENPLKVSLFFKANAYLHFCLRIIADAALFHHDLKADKIVALETPLIVSCDVANDGLQSL